MALAENSVFFPFSIGVGRVTSLYTTKHPFINMRFMFLSGKGVKGAPPLGRMGEWPKPPLC